MKNSCKECAAFSVLTRECRRHSPVMVPVPQGNAMGQVTGYAATGLYPATNEDGWCREFEAVAVAVVLQ